MATAGRLGSSLAAVGGEALPVEGELLETREGSRPWWLSLLVSCCLRWDH
ncbi:hypothetical protein KY284_003216 [Solanum tuberosum]|nr:hypothetical protein KY284_003214 [Solanum tuberosum]KAH0727351.1 hypothetical protein KY284_003216 [Solanum tuberosum]